MIGKVHELSGGMQQRVGLARAFATDAPILLMDEPFSALDPLIRARLQDELLDLQSRLKKTIIFVSHDLDEAIKLGNRIAIMEGGVIVQNGAPEEIILNPASGYVADFVAHMNPLHVLRAHTIMRPPSENEATDAGLPRAPADTVLQSLVERLEGGSGPVLIEQDGAIVGAIGAEEIYRGCCAARPRPSFAVRRSRTFPARCPSLHLTGLPGRRSGD